MYKIPLNSEFFPFSDEEMSSFRPNNSLHFVQTEKVVSWPIQLSLFNNRFVFWSKLLYIRNLKLCDAHKAKFLLTYWRDNFINFRSWYAFIWHKVLIQFMQAEKECNMCYSCFLYAMIIVQQWFCMLE
jgi:hypothetical protein